MKKKILSILITVLALCTCLFTLTACGENEPPHTHVYDKQVVSDAFKASDATCEDKAEYHYSCSCGEEGTETFKHGEKLGHAYGDWISIGNGQHKKTCVNDNSHTITESCSGGTATCTEKAKCKYCGVEYGSKLGHSFGVPTYTWNNDKCTATRVCSIDNTHIETETVVAVYVKDTDVTCDTPETGHYKAMFNNSAFAEQNTAKDSVVNGCALNHSYGTSTYTWNGNQCTAKRVCKNDIIHVESETVTGTYEKDTDATCTEPEKGHYVATFTNSAFTTQVTATNSVDKGSKKGHSFIDYNYNNNATCTENGTETAICDRDDCNETDTREKLNTKLGHNYGTPKYSWSGDKCTATRTCGRDSSHKETEIVTAKYVKDTDATCTEPEKGHYVATFTNNAFTTQTTATNSVDKGEKLGHSFTDYIYNNNATCTENGTETAICSRDNCEEPHTREKENSALGHDWKKDGTPIVNCTLSGGTQSFKCGRCTATKKEAVTTVLSGAPNTHNGLSVGDICQHCGKEVLAKNGSSLVMKIDDTNYQIEHYEGKAVGFSKYKDYIKSAYISDSVTEIGNDAFYNYSALTSVEIPNGVAKIGNYVFYGCASLESIIISDSVTSLGTGVFEGCTGLKTLVLGNGLTEIKEGLLSGCSALENLTIPFVGNNVTETTASRSTLFGYIFGTSSFDGGMKTKQYYTNSYETYYIPTSLKSVTVLGGNILYGAFRACSSLTSIEIPDSVTSVGDYAFSGCSSLKSIEIPDSVTSIGGYAFYNCKALKNITMHNTVTSIGGCAFEDCESLTTIEIPKSVTSIGGYAFDGCYGLVNAYYLGDIDQWAQINFGYSSNPIYYADNFYINDELLTEVNLTKTTKINSYAFDGCTSITRVEIPESVAYIGESAFGRTDNLNTINYLGTIDQWVEIDIDGQIFNASRNLYINGELVTDVNLTKATKISDYAFCGYSLLTNVSMCDSVISIGAYAFYNCTNLECVNTGNGVISIGEEAFSYCVKLNTISLYQNLESVGDDAFYRCTELSEVNYYGTLNDWAKIEFSSASTIRTSAPAFYTANPVYYAKKLYIDGKNALLGEISLSGEKIGAYAFAGCDSITAIYVDDCVKEIGVGAFYGCTALEEITIPFVGKNIDSAKEYEQVFGHIFGVMYSGKSSIFSTYQCYYNGASHYYAVPSSLKKISITTAYDIPSEAFRDCKNLTSVAIGKNITTIKSSAFYNCTSLIRVYYDGTIDDWAQIEFDGASANPLYYAPNLYIENNLVTEVSLNTTTVVKNYVFYNCYSITDVLIGSNVETINDYAFYGCENLSKITISNNVNAVGSYAFGNCKSLTNIKIPNSVTNIGTSALVGCDSIITLETPIGSLSNLFNSNIPTSLNTLIFNGTTVPYVSSSTIKNIIVKDSVSQISCGVFENCSSLESITLPFVGRAIGDTEDTHFSHIFGGYEAWDNASSVPDSLKNVTINGGYISRSAFANCSMIENILIGQGVTGIDNTAFNGCSNLKFNEYDNAYYLGNDNNEFFALIKAKDTSITHCIINDNTKIIADGAFKDCSLLKEVEIPNGITSIGDSAFYNCSSLTSMYIPNSVTNIGNYAFYNCSGLSSINIPNKVTEIGKNVFYNCSGLTSIDIPNSVTSIGDYAFYGCSSLASVNYIGTIDQWVQIDFKSNDSNPLYYAEKLYINNELVTEANITTATKINSYAFRNCSSLTSIEIPASVTSIGSSAFSGCSSLASIEIPDSVTSIGNSAFRNCISLTSITIGDSVTSIGDYAFYNCSKLTSVTFEDTSTWYRTTSSSDWNNKTGGTQMSVTSSSANATWFKSTYNKYYWYKI